VELAEALAQCDAADVVAHQRIADREQHRAADQEDDPVQDGQAQADRGRRPLDWKL
jgi:hypothetical protein